MTQHELPLVVGLHTLKAAGAKLLTISYSGSGDSGGIDSVQTHPELDIPTDLQELIEDWAWKHAIPGYGWENNEGASGEVELDLDTFEAATTHTDNVEEPGEQQEVTLTPTPAVQAVLEQWKAAGRVPGEFAIYPDGDGPFQLDAWSGDEKCPDFDVFRTWVDEVLEHFETGDAGGYGDLTIDPETLVVTASYHATDMGGETQTFELEDLDEKIGEAL